jgi:hypothetical protein
MDMAAGGGFQKKAVGSRRKQRTTDGAVEHM